MHAQLTKPTQRPRAEVERCIELAADDSRPQGEIRLRLRRIQDDRASAQAGLLSTTAELPTGADILTDTLDELPDPARYYNRAGDPTRSFMMQTFYTKSLLDDDAIDSRLDPPFDDFHAAASAQEPRHPRHRNRKTPPTRGDAFIKF